MSNLNIVPSRMNLQIYKQKIVGAKKGHELLKKKCDALKARFRTVMLALLDTKQKMGTESQEAFLFLASAQWAAGDFSQNVKEAVKRSSIRIDTSGENVAGVFLPIMHVRELEDADSNMNQIGLDRGGAQISKARDKFKELLVLLVQIASHQTGFVTLDQVIKVTNRRVNALEYIVIPRFILIQQYILQELDEISKEEFFRLKKVLSNKKKIIEIEQEEFKQRQELLQEKGIKIKEQSAQFQDQDQEEKQDLIF